MSAQFTIEEIKAIQFLFSTYDDQLSGFITPTELGSFLSYVVTNSEENSRTVSEAVAAANNHGEVRISFQLFLQILGKIKNFSRNLNERSNKFNMSILKILQTLCQRSVKEGNYVRANECKIHFDTLASMEEKRRQNLVIAKQLKDKLNLRLAHDKQALEFSQNWDRFMSETEEQNKSDLVKLRSIHEKNMVVFQQRIQNELDCKPPKWSKELIEWRKRQKILAKQKNYTEAQKIKTISDALEDEEQAFLNSHYFGSAATKENNLRKLQNAEIQALLKRINVQRKEYEKKRIDDCNRLEKRNRNIQAVLERKQDRALRNFSETENVDKKRSNDKSRHKQFRCYF